MVPDSCSKCGRWLQLLFNKLMFTFYINFSTMNSEHNFFWRTEFITSYLQQFKIPLIQPENRMIWILKDILWVKNNFWKSGEILIHNFFSEGVPWPKYYGGAMRKILKVIYPSNRLNIKLILFSFICKMSKTNGFFWQNLSLK